MADTNIEDINKIIAGKIQQNSESLINKITNKLKEQIKANKRIQIFLKKGPEARRKMIINQAKKCMITYSKQAGKKRRIKLEELVTKKGLYSNKNVLGVERDKSDFQKLSQEFAFLHMYIDNFNSKDIQNLNTVIITIPDGNNGISDIKIMNSIEQGIFRKAGSGRKGQISTQPKGFSLKKLISKEESADNLKEIWENTSRLRNQIYTRIHHEGTSGTMLKFQNPINEWHTRSVDSDGYEVRGVGSMGYIDEGLQNLMLTQIHQQVLTEGYKTDHSLYGTETAVANFVNNYYDVTDSLSGAYTSDFNIENLYVAAKNINANSQSFVDEYIYAQHVLDVFESANLENIFEEFSKKLDEQFNPNNPTTTNVIKPIVKNLIKSE